MGRERGTAVTKAEVGETTKYAKDTKQERNFAADERG